MPQKKEVMLKGKEKIKKMEILKKGDIMKKFCDLKFFGLVGVLTVAIVFVSINFVHAKKKQQEPPPIPLLELYPVNIVTAQPGGDGLLKVWGYPGMEELYDNIWTTEGIHHASVAIGDADNNGLTEIVAPTYRRVREGTGKSGKDSYYEMFFNVYNDEENNDEENIWLSSEIFMEDGPYWTHEITIADVDGLDDVNGNPGNEVVMITTTQLVVYRYEGAEFNIISSTIPSVNGYTLDLESVTVGDIDGDNVNEILVSANAEGVDNLGYVLIFDFDGATLNPFPEILPIDANLSGQSLRVGDLNGSEGLEICSTGYRKVDDIYEAYIFIWDSRGSLINDGHRIFAGFEYENRPWVHLDVGDIDGVLGDEIVLGSSHPDLLILYSWDGNNLNHIGEGINPEGIHPGCNIMINKVYIADADCDDVNEIIACGFGRLPSDSPRKGKGKPLEVVNDFYLEVFDAGLSSIWHRIGGDPNKNEYEVWYAAIGKKLPTS